MTTHAGLEFDFPPSTHERWTNDNIVHGVIEQETYGRDFRGVIVDIGANIGSFVCFAGLTAELVRAFEPDPTNFRYLEGNVARNRAKLAAKVDARNAGVGFPAGRRPLFVNSVNCGSYSLYPHPNWKNEKTEVDIVTLEEALAGLDVVDVLKLDCEGAEWEFLTPAADLSRVRRIVMELHLHDAGKTVAAMKAILAGHGFSSTVRAANVQTAVTIIANRV